MRPSLTVQILQWGNTDHTLRAVAAVKRSAYRGTVEILVRDNASPSGPGAVADLDDVIFIQGDENVGFGPGHNSLARLATGELLVILNNDTIVDPCALDRLVDRHLADDRPGAVTPQYRDADGRVLEMGGYIGAAGEGWQLFRDQRPPRSLRRLSYRATYGSAACLLVSRADFERLGGFDDEFAPAYYEDADLCMRLRREGRATVVEPGAVVYHFEGTTAGRSLDAGVKRHQARNRTRFAQRWQAELEGRPQAGFSSALADALSPRAEGGRRILWLASHLPQPDREAGWLRTLDMIEALQDAGDRVAIWAEHCLSEGRYGRLLEDRGIAWFGLSHERRWRTSPDDAPLEHLGDLLHAVPWDVAIVAFPHTAIRMIPAVREQLPHVPVLVDAVDLHFMRYERARQIGIPVEPMLTKADELAVYRASDGVILASHHEAVELAAHLPGVLAWVYTMAATPPVTVPGDAATNVLFLGNFMHPPNVDAVDWWVRDLGPAVEAATGRAVPLRIVGNGSEALRQRWSGREAESVDIAGWVEDLEPEFAAARVFLAPLRYGAGTKGKILAALAHGTPVVTTAVGAEGNHGAVADGLSVADDPQHLADLVAQLLNDDDAWEHARKRATEASHAAWRHQQAVDTEFAAWVRRRAVPVAR